MTKYNKHRTAYWSAAGLGGWYLLKRGQTRKFWATFPNSAYYLPRTLDWEVDEITPEYREILLDAMDDAVFIAVWVKMQRAMSQNRERSQVPVLNEYSRRIRDL